jgi:hypothetical protein
VRFLAEAPAATDHRELEALYLSLVAEPDGGG